MTKYCRTDSTVSFEIISLFRSTHACPFEGCSFSRPITSCTCSRCIVHKAKIADDLRQNALGIPTRLNTLVTLALIRRSNQISLVVAKIRGVGLFWTMLAKVWLEKNRYRMCRNNTSIDKRILRRCINPVICTCWVPKDTCTVRWDKVAV